MIYAEPDNARRRSFADLLDYSLRTGHPAEVRRHVMFAVPANLPFGIGRAADDVAATISRALASNRRGRKPDRTALHCILSWHPEDHPTAEHMVGTARRALIALGLGEHQAVLVGHDDTDKRHVHIVANVIHPVTGKAAKLGWRYRVMSRWAAAYEREQGIIRCPKRFIPKAANENRRRLRKAAFLKTKQPSKQKASNPPAPRP